MPTLKELYTALKADGAPLPDTYENFESYMTSGPNGGYTHRKEVYDALKADGAPLPDTYEAFSKALFAPREKGNDADDTDISAGESIPGDKPWRPMPQWRVRNDVDAVMEDFNRGTTASLDRARRVAERVTPEGQRKLKRAETHARLNGLPTRTAGITPVATGGSEGQTDTSDKPADARMLSGQGPVPYGVKMVEGEPVTQWLLPDGSLTTDIIEADKAEYGARNVRLMNEFTGRMKKNGLDPANQDDVETQRQKDRMSNLTVSSRLRQAMREQERLDELMRRRRDEIEAEGKARPGLSFLRGMADESHGMAGSIVNDNGMKDYRLDDEYRQLESAARKNRQTIQTLTDRQNDRMDSFWHSLGTTFTNGYTLTDGMAEMNDAIALMSAKKHVTEINRKRKSGEALTRDEEAAEAVLGNTLIDDEVQETIGQEYGSWARAGSMFSMSLDLMKDIMLTPGAGTIAKGIASGVSKGLGRGVSKAVARVAGEKAAEKAAENLATRFLTKATGVLIGAHAAGAVVSNTAGIGHTLGETATGVAGKVTKDGNGYAFTDEKGMLEAMYDAERNQIRENGSEMFGEFIPGIGGLVTKGLEKIGLKRISEQLTKIGSKDWYKQYSSLLESGGYNGLPGEAIEEYEGYLFDILTGHGEEAMKELADKNTHIDIWLGCATTGALLGAVPMVMHGGHTAMYYRYKHAAGKSDGVASAVIGDRWDGIRDRIDGTPNEQLADVLTDVLANENLGERETTAMMDYVRNLAKMRGYNLVQIASVEDGEEMSHVEADAEESFRDGYSATTPQEMNDAKRMLDLQRQRLASSLSDDMVREYDADPIGALSRTADPELRRIAADYVNAKQLYDGMIQRVRDDIDGRVALSDVEIDIRVNRQTGMLQPATMKDDRQVFIVSGEVAMLDDGTAVDTAKSSESIIIRDAETGKIEFADPAQILNVGEGMDATAEKEAARNRITQEMAQAAADNIDGKLSFAPGESYSLLDSEGNDMPVTVLGQTIDENGQPVDGSVDVQYPDGSIQPVPKADMQQQVDAANERRVAQFDEERSADETGETLPENEPYNAVGAAVAGEWLTGSGENAISSADYLVKALSGLFPMASEAIERIRVENQDSLNVFIDDFLADTSLWNKVTGAIRDKVRDVYGAGEAVDILDELLRYPKGAPYRIGQELSARLDRLNASAGRSEAEAPAHDRIIGHEEEKQPALSRIPVDEKGDPIYEQVEPDLAWDGLLEESRGNEKIARSVIAQEIAEREDALKKLEKQKPKAGLSTKEKIAAELARQDHMDAIQRSIDHWKRMGETVQRRQAEAERMAAEESRRKAEERRAQEEQAQAEREEAERKEREALNGVPDWSHDTPQDARARGYRRFGPEKVDRQETVASVVGKDIEVRFGEGELPKGKAALIDVSSLQPSHIDGMRNPRHFLDEAQPKERTDAPSRDAARKIASGIRPEEITSSVTAYTGAPTVNSRGETIQGNSRSDALRTMYESYPEQAAKYRQYLIDHAADFGLTPEQVEGMEKPVLVNMLDVTDDEAIRLGQFVAQDTESGGIERIKPRNAVKKMGAKIRDFANLLLRSSDDEASLSQLVDSNGVDVLKWMAQQGFINDTQYASAFDSKGNLTGEAANDLRGILFQSVFTGGSTRLEEMFSNLPAKAQRAILATAFRDYDSSRAHRMVGEIQQSIMAYNDMMQYDVFTSATNMNMANAAAAAWKRQYAMDDVTGEPYLPSEKFSNFALALAAMYKGGTQRFIQQTFSDLYDAVQGTAQDTLFEEADKTPKTLAEAIRKVLDIEYQPINKNDNGDNGGNAVDIDTPQGEAGRSGSDGNAGGGERGQDGGRTADSGRGAEADSRERKDVVGRSLTREEATHLISQMESNAEIAPIIDLTPENWIEQFGEDGKVETPVGTVKMGENQFMKLFSRKRAEYFGMIKPTLTNPDVIIEKTAPVDGAERDTKLLFIKTFIKPDGSRIVHFESVTVQRDGMEVSISSHEAKAKDIKKDMQKEKILHISDKLPLSSEWSLTEAPDIPEGPDLVPTSDNDISYGKDNTLSSEKQGNEEKSSLGSRISEAEATVNTEPTEAQKEAGNYRMGHVQVGSFDVTIENPKGSKRSGKDADGRKWETTMTHTYGYIRGTKGVDGDQIDVYISSEVDDWNGRKVFVVDQYNPDGSFDEHKVMYGFPDAEAARAAYLSNYEKGWDKTRRIDVTGVTKEDFKKWIQSSRRKTKPFADYRSVKDRVDTVSSVDKPSDSQGNPIDERGNLIVEDVKSTDEISDEDFSNPTRTIGLPQLPRTVSDAIGAGGRKPIIKKNIFAKNRDSHKDLTPEDGRKILREVLYNPKLYGQNQKETRPYNWILVQLDPRTSG